MTTGSRAPRAVQLTVETSKKLEDVYRAIGSPTHVIEQHIRNGEKNKKHKASCTIKQLRHLNPPFFRGATYHLVAETWVTQMEKIFDVLDCAEEQKLPFATFIFEGEAKHWWRMINRILLQRDDEPLTWDIFLEAFNYKYFPLSVWDHKEVELLELARGGGL